MDSKEIRTETRKLVAEYKQIESLDGARDMLVARYGETDFEALRERFIIKCARIHNKVEKQKQKVLDRIHNIGPSSEEALKVKLAKAEKLKRKAAAKAAPQKTKKKKTKAKNKMDRSRADRIKMESITTRHSIHTLRG